MIELTMYLHLSKFTLKNTKDGPKYRTIKTEEKAKFVTVIRGTYTRTVLDCHSAARKI